MASPSSQGSNARVGLWWVKKISGTATRALQLEDTLNEWAQLSVMYLTHSGNRHKLVTLATEIAELESAISHPASNAKSA